MRSFLFGLLFWAVGGAVAGSIHASGLGALFGGDARDRRRALEPITREEYTRRMRVYPLYGAGIGLGVGLLFSVRACSRRRRDSATDEGA